MTTTEAGLLTADNLLRLHSEGVRGELIQGVLCKTMSTGREHGEIAANTAYELLSHIKPLNLGVVTTSDSGVRLARDPDTVREPDVAFFSAQRIGSERVSGYSDVVPDLVVEIVSPTDDPENVYNKARMWISFGVRLVWVVQPDSRSVEVHRAEPPHESIDEDGQLGGYDVLPGFVCPVKSIFGS